MVILFSLYLAWTGFSQVSVEKGETQTRKHQLALAAQPRVKYPTVHSVYTSVCVCVCNVNNMHSKTFLILPLTFSTPPNFKHPSHLWFILNSNLPPYTHSPLESTREITFLWLSEKQIRALCDCGTLTKVRLHTYLHPSMPMRWHVYSVC